MKDGLVERVRAIQASMVESGRSYFSERELDHLRGLIRLTVQFFDYLHELDLTSPDETELLYASESVFAGIDSFCLISSSYRALDGASRSTLPWTAMPPAWIKEQFEPMYHKFTVETDLAEQCRLLLDLFKLQIVFAGMSYD